MPSKPLVSVVIPTKDRASELEGAIGSVERQTYDELEIIVIDDSSTDRTPAVVEKLQERHREVPIRYVRNEKPQGPGGARNCGVAIASGSYVSFLDDDDRWKPEKTERQVRRLQEAPERYAVVYCGFVLRGENGQRVSTFVPSHEGDIYEELLPSFIVGNPPTLLLRREAFEAVGGFDETLPQGEDWELTQRLARRYRFTYVADPLVTVHRHADQTTKNVEQAQNSAIRILDRNRHELATRGLEAEAHAIVNRNLGSRFCLAGDTEKGREAFRRSLEHEFDLYTLAAYILATTGPETYRRISRFKRKASSMLGRIKAITHS